MASEWYFQSMSNEFGPFSADEMRYQAAIGRITIDTPVRKGKERKWIPASEVKGLLERSNATDSRLQADSSLHGLSGQASAIKEEYKAPVSKVDKKIRFKKSTVVIAITSLAGLMAVVVCGVLIDWRKEEIGQQRKHSIMRQGDVEAAKGEQALQDSDWDLAIAYFTAALKQSSDNGDWLAKRGYATAQKAVAESILDTAKFQKYMQTAISDCSDAIRLSPTRENLMTRAEVYVLADYKQAEIQKASKANYLTDSLSFTFGTITLNNLTELRSKAIADYSQALQIDSSDLECYIRRATLFRSQGEYKSAMTDCNKAISLDDHCDKAFYLRAEVFHDCGGDDKALADVQEAIRLMPNGYRSLLHEIESEPIDKQLNNEIADAEDWLKSSEDRLKSKKLLITSTKNSRDATAALVNSTTALVESYKKTTTDTTDDSLLNHEEELSKFKDELTEKDSEIKSYESERAELEAEQLQVKSEIERLKGDLQKRRVALINLGK